MVVDKGHECINAPAVDRRIGRGRGPCRQGVPPSGAQPALHDFHPQSLGGCSGRLRPHRAAHYPGPL
jgi:hypothetical protein